MLPEGEEWMSSSLLATRRLRNIILLYGSLISASESVTEEY
jgi:hypothetical protein